jgi:hypothetical protein
MRWLGRACALILIVFILIVTPIALWIYNVQRVALDPQTYKRALRSQNAYQDLLPALIEAPAAKDSKLDPAHRAALQALVDNMPPDDWTALSDKLLPASWLQDQIEGNINRIFSWIDAARPTPGINFDLTELKTRLSDNATARQAVDVVVQRLPRCTPAQETLIDRAVSAGSVEDFPLCYPASADRQRVVVEAFTNVLNSVGTQLPDHWDLNEQLRQAARGQQASEELMHLRAVIWLQSRLTVLLLLVPLALLSMIVIVAIRSGKQFFRWTGWAMIGSGLLTLVPVPFMPGMTLGLYAGSRGDSQEGFGETGRLLTSLIGGMVASIASSLTLAVLVQVAIVIGLGFGAVVLSVLLPMPEPEVTNQQAQWDRQAVTPMPQPPVVPSGTMATAMGSTPRPAMPADPATELLDQQP